jgi:hypothetical protein
MRRPGRFLVLCLLLLLLPLRSLLAAGQLGCEPPPVPQEQHAGHAHHASHGDAHDHAAKPCKLCAPCCLAAAPPPVLVLSAVTTAPAERVALAPAKAWASVVPPLPDPPPRA